MERYRRQGAKPLTPRACDRDGVGSTRVPMRVWLALAGMAALAILVYLNSLGGDFVWDDRQLIVNDRAVKSWGHLGEVFASDFFERNEDDLPYGYYRPLTTVSYLADFSLWGLQPFGYHLTNVLLHAACSVMVGMLLVRLRFGWLPAVSAGLFFAVHPIHSESVAWIAGRTDLVAFFFCGLAFLSYLRANDAPATGEVAEKTRWIAGEVAQSVGSRRRRLGRFAWLGLSSLMFAAGLLAKEMSVVLVGWLGLVEVMINEHRWQRALVTVSPYLVVVATYVVWRFLVIGVPVPGVPPEHNLAAVLRSLAPTIVRYLAWMAWPTNLSGYVQNPYVTSLSDPRFAFSWLILGLLVAVAYRVGRRDRRVVLAAAMLAVSFVPVLNFVRVAAPADMGNVMAERFCYFPSFPFVALVGVGVEALLRRASKVTMGPAAVAAAAAGVVLYASWVTTRRNADWSDDLTFLTKTLEQSPSAALLWGNLANYQLGKRNLGAAKAAIERAAELDPDSYAVLSSRALWYVVAERYAEAIPLQERIVAHAGQGRTAALNNLAYLYRRTGREDAALDILRTIVSRGHGYADVYYNLAEIERARGDAETARQDYRRGLEARPNDLRIAQALAEVELEAGRPEEAEHIYRQMLEIYPDDPRLLNNLALIVHDRGDARGALQLLGRVVAGHPDYVNGHMNYAQLLEEAGRAAEAAAQLEDAVRRAEDAEQRQAAAAKLATLRAKAGGATERR
jgi:tetratricopeptide (TPR) repeat protein